MKPEDETLTALANLDRLKMLQLMNENHKPFTFTDFQKALKLKKGSVTFHVKSLLKAGLIANIYERRVESNPRVYSYYTLTSYGAFALDVYKQLQQHKKPATSLRPITVHAVSPTSSKRGSVLPSVE